MTVNPPISTLAAAILSAPGRLSYLASPSEADLSTLIQDRLTSGSLSESKVPLTDQQEADSHIEQIVESLQRIGRFQAVLRQRPDQLSKAWIRESSRLTRGFVQNPTSYLECVVARQASASVRLQKILESNGSIAAPLLMASLASLWEESQHKSLFQEKPKAYRARSGLAKAAELSDDPYDHAGFIKAFSRECGVSPIAWRGVSNGVYLTLNQADSEKISREFQGVNDWVGRITDKLGYLIIKRGYTPSTDGAMGCNDWIFLKNDDFNQETQKALDATQEIPARNRLKPYQRRGQG